MTTCFETKQWAADAAAPFRPAVHGRYLYTNVFRAGLCIFDEDVEIAVIVENAGIDQFVFAVGFVTPGIFVIKIFIGKCGVRIFV